ncbi:NAD(P)H-dependent oxidoreductase [Bowmanella dokdonensis]
MKYSQDEWIRRDLGAQPPEFISEDWIAACFTPTEQRTEAQRQILALSDTLIEEVARADIILLSTPMYNYGMPAALKAWFDQVIRINKTFSFDLTRGDFPLAPIMSGKSMVVLSSTGEFGFEAGGIRQQMNHLVPHIRTVSHYLGVEHLFDLQVQYQEFKDQRHQDSKSTALEGIGPLMDKLGPLHK